MLVDIIAVRTLPNYGLELNYANGELRRFDMRLLLTMTPWTAVAAQAIFDRVYVEHGTVAWPGDVDVAPETLYADSVPVDASTARSERRS